MDTFTVLPNDISDQSHIDRASGLYYLTLTADSRKVVSRYSSDIRLWWHVLKILAASFITVLTDARFFKSAVWVPCRWIFMASLLSKVEKLLEVRQYSRVFVAKWLALFSCLDESLVFSTSLCMTTTAFVCNSVASLQTVLYVAEELSQSKRYACKHGHVFEVLSIKIK